jgi:hypothetical protein
MRTGAAIPVRIVRKCALRATIKRLMHRAGSIVRSPARRKRRPPTAYLAAGRRSTAQSALNAGSAGLFGPGRADRCGHLRRRGPDAELSQAGSIANGIVGLTWAHLDRAAPVLARTAFTSSTLRAVDARVASRVLVGLSSNALVHYVAGDRAPTCPVADRRKTKPSDREARARRGDRDRPTPKGTAERSARA